MQFVPSDSYVDAVRSVYLADVERVDFTGGGVDRINAWASEKTNGKIPEVLKQGDVGSNTAIVITNSIYFKGTWVTQFSEDETRESYFWMNSTESIMTDFMNVRAKFDYAKVDGAQMLRMPYEGGRLSMLAILPDGRDGMSGLDSAVSTMQIERWRQDMRPQEVIVSVPKFTTKTHYGLMGPLSNLGVTDAFNPGTADLSGIVDTTSRNLYVSKATHDAYVDVNEVGTEAAAITAVVLDFTSAQPPPPMFIVNHPFIFIIQDDESGAILFMGRLSDPTA